MVRKKPVAAIAAAALVLAAGAVVWLARAPRHTLSGPQRGDAGALVPARAAQPPAAPVLPPARSGDGEESLEGRVEDGAGAAIAGVAVIAEREDGPGAPADAGVGLALDPEIVAHSGADGTFRLVGMAVGNYRLRIEGPEVFDAELRFVSVPGPSLSIVALRKTHLEGWVTRAGLPASGVAVRAQGEAGAEIAAVTDERGRFRMDELPEGRYRVAAFGRFEASETQAVSRAGPGPHPPVRLALVPAFDVSGRVVDDDGSALAARVRMSSSEGDIDRHTAADGDGRFVMAGVRPGTWTALADSDGYVSAEEVSFEVGTDYQPLLRVSRGGAIAGTVIDSAGRAVSGAEIALVGGEGAPESRDTASSLLSGNDARFVPSGELGILRGPIPMPPPPGARALRVASPLSVAPGKSGEPELVTSDSRGTFELTGLRAGRYRVQARHPDYAGGRSAYLDVALGDRKEVSITLSSGSWVAGVVSDESGSPVGGAIVTAGDPGGPGVPRMTAFTGSDGRYRLGPLAGTVVIGVDAIGYAPAETRVELGQDQERLVDVELGRADARVRGRVVDASGFAVAEVLVELGRGAGRGALTDEHGRFEIAGLAEGVHPVTLTKEGYPPVRTRVSTAETSELRLLPGGAIEIEVIDAHSRRPLSGARIGLRGAHSESRVAGELGRVRLEALAVGRYRLSASHDGYVPSEREIEVPAAPRPGALSLPGLRLELERGATVAGLVRDRDGERVGGARVQLGQVSGHSDLSGRFRLESVPTGRVVLEASKGDERGRLSLDLAPGDELVTVEIALD